MTKMPKSLAPSRLRGLVKPDRVHRRLYTDPDIFDLEMDYIFGRSWVYVAHESQVPKPSDFLTTRIGTQPVVVVRHTDGKVHVLFNRCGHRGAVVENLPKGNAKHFRCCYHGWVFKTNGELASVPLKNGYPEDFDFTDPKLGMVPVADVEAHGGFVFARLRGGGGGVPDLATHLGPMKGRIDDLLAWAPDGAAMLSGGVHKYRYRGNWKLQMENLPDLYHPPFSHESSVPPGAAIAERQGGSDGDRPGIADSAGVWSFEHGHTYIGTDELLGDVTGDGVNGPVGSVRGAARAKYVAALEKSHGKARTRKALAANWLNAVFYPNLCLQSTSQHVRVVHPIAVDETEVYVYPIRLAGAPIEVYRQVVKYLNITHAVASLVQTDDMEAFERVQEGLSTQGSDWVMFARGLGRETPRNDGGYHAFGTNEMPMRNQYRAWVDCLCARN